MTEEQLKQTLRGRGQRVTPQRVLIHRALADLGRHATAEEVLARLPSASLPTVYATLELFEELGIVRRVPTGHGPTLWDPGTDGHHHLVCRACGSVEDIGGDVDTAGVLRRARRRGFMPDSAELVVSGLCPRCAG
ncbi:MAG: Fur family transcriptional regulator, stress-responsive regulator [Thermoleophilaceae bacterium]|jgi:Fe2+ or Zn2+ uptake regulation protein|nr:Fur family transcriptional regulator, stress-responsive regulator [Thermoleophilaceae bacterium]